MVAPFTDMSQPGLTRSAACDDVAIRAAIKTVAFAKLPRLLFVRNANVIHLSLAADCAAVRRLYYGSVKPDATLHTFYASIMVTSSPRAHYDPRVPADAFEHFRETLQALTNLFCLYGRSHRAVWPVERWMDRLCPIVPLPPVWNLRS